MILKKNKRRRRRREVRRKKKSSSYTLSVEFVFLGAVAGTNKESMSQPSHDLHHRTEEASEIPRERNALH